MLDLTLLLINSSFIWSRIRSDPNRNHLSSIFFATTCWNIWKERNNITFNNSSVTVEACVYRGHLDIFLWTDQLSDRERVCITTDKEDYIEEISPRTKEGAARVGIEE